MLYQIIRAMFPVDETFKPTFIYNAALKKNNKLSNLCVIL